jgi:hypothetical protein
LGKALQPMHVVWCSAGVGFWQFPDVPAAPTNVQFQG